MPSDRERGESAEQRFKRHQLVLGRTIVSRPDRFVERRDHYDFRVRIGEDILLVEVKSDKAPYICVEWQAVRENLHRLGWVRGKADWIAFEQSDGFLWVKRSELEERVRNIDWANPSKYKGLYVAYTRPDRDDLITFVTREDLWRLPSTKKEVDTPDHI